MTARGVYCPRRVVSGGRGGGYPCPGPVWEIRGYGRRYGGGSRGSPVLVLPRGERGTPDLVLTWIPPPPGKEPGTSDWITPPPVNGQTGVKTSS